MHPNVIASCERLVAVVVGDHGAMDVLTTSEIIVGATFVLIQVEEKVVRTLLQSSHPSGGEFEAFQICKSVGVSALEDMTGAVVINFGAFDEARLKPTDCTIPSPIRDHAHKQAIVGVRQAVALLKNEVHLLVGAAQCEIAWLAGLGLHTAKVFVHDKSTHDGGDVRLVWIKNLEQIIPAECPNEVIIGQQQLVVCVIYLGAKAGFFVFHGGAVKPLDVFARVKV